jgi:type I restriction enzyme, S subunit
MGEWIDTTIGKQVTLQRGIDITRLEQRPGTVPVISSGGISSYHDTAGASGPGVILGRKGVVGSVYYVETDYWPHDTTLWVKDFHGNEPRFIYYFFLSIASRLATLDVGTANPTLNRNHVHPIKIKWPAVKGEQHSIASTLGALDDKIDFIRRMNRTLEGMALAIFKDWFVDFGPTRAKMEGQPPYLEAATWSLFPDRFSDVGIPEGWSIEPVYDQATWVNGAAYRDMHFSSEPDALPVVKIAELKNGVSKTTRFTNTDLGDRYKIRDGELLFSWSGNPDTSIDAFIWTSGYAWLNQHIFAVRFNGKRSQAFLYVMLKHLRSAFAEIARNKQTTGLGHVTQQDLIRLKVIAPSEKVRRAFDDIVGPLYSKLTNNLFENQSLVAMRDFLLPKLMSGAVSVKAIEKAVGKAI